MTANHEEDLDPALVRPGRIDKKIHMGNISRRCAERMYRRTYSDEENALGLGDDDKAGTRSLDELATIFSNGIVEGKFTPAELQGYLLNHRHDREAAAMEIEAWVLENETEASKECNDVAGSKANGLHVNSEKEHGVEKQ